MADAAAAAAPPPSKVLLTATTFPRWAGDARPLFILDLARGLVRAGWEVHLLAPHCRGAARAEVMDGVRVSRFRYAPAALERLAYGAGILPNVKRNPFLLLLVLPFLVAQLLATLRLLRRERIALLNAHWIFPQGLTGLAAAALAPGVRLVTTVHGGDIFALARVRPMVPLLRLVLARSARVTVNSSATGEAVRAVCPGAAIEPIPMGVDAGLFSPARADAALRRRLAPGGGPLLLFCGRLALKKGVRYLIEAMPAVRERHPAAVLAIVGDGEEGERLRQQVRDAGLEEAVRFVGAVPNAELPPFYASADLFVCPSIVDERGDTEGLGVVLLEAAASALPVVASRVGGIPDVVRDGENGFLVAEKSPGEIAAAVLRLLADAGARRRLGERSRALVEGEFTWARVAGRFAALFRAVSGGTRP